MGQIANVADTNVSPVAETLFLDTPPSVLCPQFPPCDLDGSTERDIFLLSLLYIPIFFIVIISCVLQHCKLFGGGGGYG